MLYIFFLLAGLLGCALGIYGTKRRYRRALAAAQADAAQGWADYQEVAAMAARWKRLYYTLLNRA